MLDPEWDKKKPDNSTITLETVANHIDHVCQLAGNPYHAAIGTDLDGGFGREQSPSDVDSIADLPKNVGTKKYKSASEELAEKRLRIVEKFRNEETEKFDEQDKGNKGRLRQFKQSKSRNKSHRNSRRRMRFRVK